MSINRLSSIAVISIFCWLFSVTFGMIGLTSIIDLIYGNILDDENFFFSPLFLATIGIGLSILYFSTGIGLWRLKQWARWTAIIISCLMILINLVIFSISLVNGQSTELTVGILHGLALISLFSAKVRLAFSPS